MKERNVIWKGNFNEEKIHNVQLISFVNLFHLNANFFRFFLNVTKEEKIYCKSNEVCCSWGRHERLRYRCFVLSNQLLFLLLLK